MGNSDNVIGYIEYLSNDGKIIGYVTPFTDVDKFMVIVRLIIYCRS